MTISWATPDGGTVVPEPRPQGVPTVLTVNRVGFLGGVERIIVGCADAARTSGYRPVIACPAPGDLANAAEARGHRVVATAVDRGKSTLSPAKLLGRAIALRTGRHEITRVARAEHAMLLHTHHPVSALLAMGAASRLGLSLIWHAHETLPLKLHYSLISRLVRARCALFAACSGASRTMLLHLGASADRISLIYNAVDPSFLGKLLPADDITRPGPHIGLFGVLEPRKGQEAFLRAAALLKHPTAQFWVVGAVSFAENDGYLAKLRTLVAESGLTDRVHFTGFRNDVPRLMASMDVVVLASTGFESLPTVLLEAGALGRRIVATDVGGVREIVCNGETGLVVERADPALLAAAISRVLEPSGAGMAEAARTATLTRFGQTRFVKDIAALYDQALDLPRGPITAEASRFLNGNPDA